MADEKTPEDKLDAIANMLRDAAEAMNDSSKRLDARLDAVEARMDRRDSEEREKEGRADKARKDGEDGDIADAARRDEGGEPKEKGDPKDVSDAARKDAEEAEKEAKAEQDRKDAEEDERKEKERADRRDAEFKDSQYMSRIEADALRAQIADLQGRVPSIISDGDRERMANAQAAADPIFQAFADRAPAPMDGETPTAYKRRLAGKMQSHSSKWKDHRLSAISDEGVLDTVIDDIYADAALAARRGVDVAPGQLRMISRNSGGHVINEFEGASESWMHGMAGPRQAATGEFRRPH